MTDAIAQSDILERRYRHLIRAYPAAWRSANGEALLGVLMEAAEARGSVRPTAWEHVDLFSHGLAERTRSAVPEATRDLIAGSALGAGLGFTLAYFVFYSWVRDDFYSGTVIAGPMWFLPAWLVLIAATRSGMRGLRIAAALLVVGVAIAVPLAGAGPFLVSPRGQNISDGPQPAHFVFGGLQVLPASAANVTVIVLLAALTITGRPRVRHAITSGAITTALFGPAFAGAVFLTQWPTFMRDDYVWTWSALSAHTYGRPFVGGAVAFGISALCVTAVVARRTKPQLAALLAVAALVLAASTIAINLAPLRGIDL